MKTLNRNNIPIIKQTNHRDYVILLEDLEFGMSKEQLIKITDLYNQGIDYKDIAQMVQRDEYEVLVALVHQVREGEYMRAFAYRE